MIYFSSSFSYRFSMSCVQKEYRQKRVERPEWAFAPFSIEKPKFAEKTAVKDPQKAVTARSMSYTLPAHLPTEAFNINQALP
ncbi:MAG: hypothetical protein HC819_02485 [Cyclobacteriaceae bacterium]|nr:hypothetical protein [Cyclobacteriaceae bacterium]